MARQLKVYVNLDTCLYLKDKLWNKWSWACILILKSENTDKRACLRFFFCTVWEGMQSKYSHRCCIFCVSVQAGLVLSISLPLTSKKPCPSILFTHWLYWNTKTPFTLFIAETMIQSDGNGAWYGRGKRRAQRIWWSGWRRRKRTFRMLGVCSLF